MTGNITTQTVLVTGSSGPGYQRGVTGETSVQSAVETTLERIKQLDVVINNAGVGSDGYALLSALSSGEVQ